MPGGLDEVEIELLELGDGRFAIVSWPLDLPRADSHAPAVLRGVRLTATEAVVVRGIARGMSNAAIAKERGTSTRTVANQVGAILEKLGVRSRYELVAVLAGAAGKGAS